MRLRRKCLNSESVPLHVAAGGSPWLKQRFNDHLPDVTCALARTSFANDEASMNVVHNSIVAAIEKAPACNLLFLRMYNLFLRAFGQTYKCRTYFGATMYCNPRDFLQHIILHFGVWEPNISATIEGILKPGDVAVDVGANVGYDTLLAASLVGPTGSVVSIEASPRIFKSLESNIASNSFRNIRPLQVAVSESEGVVDLYSGPRSNSGLTSTVQRQGLAREATVKAMPLEAILSADEIARLRLIKIDVEGAEAAIVNHFLDTIHLYPRGTSLIVEVSPSEEWMRLFDRMVGAGFSAKLIENSYDRNWYLKSRNRLSAPSQTTRLPDFQADILFTRTP